MWSQHTCAFRAYHKACAAGAGLVTLLAAAQAPDAALRPVVITGAASDQQRWTAPASIDIVDGDELRAGQLQINLSEGLGRVPGLTINNRQNYAQDLQLSIRGFGARSTFGVRGVRLYVDGIPASAQLSHRQRGPHRGHSRALLGALRQLGRRRGRALHG